MKLKLVKTSLSKNEELFPFLETLSNNINLKLPKKRNNNIDFTIKVLQKREPNNQDELF